METGTKLEGLADAIAKAEPDFDAEQQGIALEVYRALALASPLSAAYVAARTQAPEGRVEELLRSWPGVFRDRDGRVVGFWGLTIRRLSPAHRFVINGRELFTWCAWDTLFLPELLDAPARVESACPTTGTLISLTVAPDVIVETSHPDAVLSFLVPDRKFDADVVQSFCHFVHFFVSERAGEAWTASHPGTFLLPLAEAFELGRIVNGLNFPGIRGGNR